MNRWKCAAVLLCMALPSAAEEDVQKELETQKTVMSRLVVDSKQPKGWQRSAKVKLQFSQAAYDNWSAGGQNSVAWQTRFDGGVDFEGERLHWDNRLEMAYGQTRLGFQDLLKSLDRLALNSRLSYGKSKIWRPFAAAKFESQFDTGYDYSAATPLPVSKFMDPGYLTETLGVGYEPGPALQSFLGASAKQTFTNDHPAPYADNLKTAEVETLRSEAGLSWLTKLKLAWESLVIFQSTLDLFSNLKATDQIDVRFDNRLELKVGVALSVDVEIELFYDRDISDQRQLRQALTAGLSWDFF